MKTEDQRGDVGGLRREETVQCPARRVVEKMNLGCVVGLVGGIRGPLKVYSHHFKMSPLCMVGVFASCVQLYWGRRANTLCCSLKG